MNKELKRRFKNFRSGEFNYNGLHFEKRQNGNIALAYIHTDFRDLKIPEGVNEINFHCAFHYTDLKSVKFPDSLRVVREGAFSDCLYLSNVEFGKCPVEIEERAFANCNSLEAVEIENVSDVGSSAFGMCRNLREVKFLNGLSCVKTDTFYECTKLKRITLPSTIKTLERASLGFANEIFLTGNRIPDGILQAVEPNYRAKRDNILTVHIGGKTVIIPKVIFHHMWSSVEEILQKYNPEKDGNVVLYDKASFCDARWEIALEGFPFCPKPETKEFLRNGFPEMIENTETEEDFLSLFCKFRDLHLMTIDLAEEALFFAQKKNLVHAAAFVLETTRKFSKRNPSCIISTEFQL